MNSISAILLFFLCIFCIVVADLLIWWFSEVSEHELVWRVGSLVVSGIVIIGLALLMFLPCSNKSNQTVVYILNADGEIVETYEGASRITSTYMSISFDWNGKEYYFKNVPVKVIH